ncbi:Zinc finger CHY-type protein [Lasiodiplodia theobromae]|uniref:Zinc finger CHY-type protein n=1 Tax=Lasiodiplodia theobromae TaxID=45133 RepID=UPI0015C2C615|nr:Zinc finger CHY-type protein [Lasiodiplodia theobromae]KAF4537029.1 Zinc finger CHY-type protein [Lasiodiplodia theobromae]
MAAEGRSSFRSGTSSAAGCRAGRQCPFAHDASASGGQPASKARPARQRQAGEDPEEPSLASTTPTPRARVVQRPTPRAQQEDPREFQLAQIRRRFSPEESLDASAATILAFGMKPSDPDFPFDIDELACRLRVPATYPMQGRPSLSVTNAEMDRGFQINVEKGFDALAAKQLPNQTLLALMNALDRRLEQLLTAPPAETFSIKIVPNAAARAVPKHAAQVPTPPPPPPSVVVQPSQVPAQPRERPPPPQPAYGPEQRAQAKARRDQETRQLEARLGRLPHFSTLADGAFIVPVEPRRRAELPIALQAIKTVRLLVPELYPLQPCRIELMGIDRLDAMPAEQAFEDRARQFANMSLLNHVNYFSQNMHSMAHAPPATSDDSPRVLDQVKELTVQDNAAEASTAASGAEADSKTGTGHVDDRSHIITIPRPPEWQVLASDDDDEDSYDSYSDESHSDGEAEGGGSDRPGGSSQTPALERGVTVSFPHLELYGIELLELVNLCLTVKCTRCKDTLDVNNIKNNANADYTGIRSESCKKCANPLGIGYRMDMMHANSVRAGYLDLDGCTPVDMLPSPGVVSVRGDSSMAMCRECHQKMTFKIAEVKFLLVSASSAQATRALPRKKPKEKLGIVAGQELPKRGRCKHYSKSNRWFRFSCCSKVYPCDRCHDAEADHPNEHANRMICGFCSREQNYRPEDCGICHATLVGKKGSGFWEGGKDPFTTRDRVLLPPAA